MTKETNQVILPAPKLSYDPFHNRFMLIEDYVTPEHTVPAGEYVYGAKRPELAGIEGIKQYDRHLPAFIVLGWMYSNGIETKIEADKLFEINMHRCSKVFGFSPDMVDIIVLSVRFAGRGVW